MGCSDEHTRFSGTWQTVGSYLIFHKTYPIIRCMTTPETRATEQTVAENITRIRTGKGITQAVLTRRIRELSGRHIPQAALSDIENGKRRVDVGDLMALAAGLGVGPTTLLMPPAEDADTKITTSIGTYPAGVWWGWLNTQSDRDGDTDNLGYLMQASPGFITTTRPLDWKDPQIQAMAKAVATEIKRMTDGNG
jgi:transcriptional regulator with XRE-family HTH domain